MLFIERFKDECILANFRCARSNVSIEFARRHGAHGNMPIAPAARRGCAIDRLAVGKLRTRMDVITTVVRLTASGTVNCANVSMRECVCAFAGTRASLLRGWG